MDIIKRSGEQIALQYRLLSPIYDLLDILFFSSNSSNPRYRLAEYIPNESISVLDICFGTGSTSIAIAAKNEKNKITGIDLSESMLKVAYNKIQKNRLRNIQIYKMDATKIELEQEFEIVTTSLSLHEMPKDIMDSVISEMVRVLKSNGKIYILEWNRPSNYINRLLFAISVGLFEPKSFRDFLSIDWSSYLHKYNLKVEAIEKFKYTKIICACKVN